MSNVQVWCLGDVVVDLLPDGPQLFRQCPGGAPANVAVALARLGVRCGFIGCRGRDPFGRFMANTLHQEAVDVRYLHEDPEHLTSTVLVDLDDAGERSFTFLVQPSADQFLRVEQLPIFEADQWLQLSSIALAGDVTRVAAIEAMQRIKVAGGRVFFDVNIRESLWADTSLMIQQIWTALRISDVIKVSEEEAMCLTGASDLPSALAQLVDKTGALVVVTMGEKGALVKDPQHQQLIPVNRVAQVVDSTGAGDGFVGGMLSTLLTGDDWKTIISAVERGNQVGSYVVTQKGAMSALPSAAQLKF
ncbi:aminoimidazole riboside kinase [Celerinatantimonas sp. YJH-8]|uniref:aminoimidazole riboside kinase n=1 Tax=Celerinatantimonas sp. YJH-8 TaxID=3228714 RepID=UPI0038C21CA5